MLLFVLTQTVPPIMVLVLLVSLYLTWWDLRYEPDLDFLRKSWWVLLVLLFHVPGYLVFRGWIWVHRQRRRDAEHAASPGPRGRRGGGRA